MVRAYDVLKNPDTRKNYDLYGETLEKVSRPTYQSYNYYTDQFGIYDDDPLVITLSKSDYGEYRMLCSVRKKKF